jgi:CHASE1-domain containing sensor protein/tRNA A-37 threonylcarbamoyl transferase component Bud32
MGPVTVVVAGLLLTLVAAGILAGRDRVRRERDFRATAAKAVSELDVLFSVPIELAHAVAGLFLASDDVTRREFRSFVTPILARHPEIRTLEWVAMVAAPEREAVEAALRREVGREVVFREESPDGLVPAAPREHYAVIRYMEPPGDDLLGWDVLADPDGDPEVLRAAETGAAVATGGFRLREDPEGRAVLTYVPVPRDPGEPPVGPAGLRGLLAVILRVDELLERAPSVGGASDIALLLVDESAGADESLLHRDPAYQADATFHATHAIRFADRTWRADLVPGTPDPWAPSQTPRWVLLVGSVLSLVAGWGLHARGRIAALGREVAAVREIGQYRVGQKLGEGGMGLVYEAEHALLARRAAIKFIREEGGADPATFERFEREARLTASLRSPHTVQVYDFGRTDDGAFYYVMEYLDGVDLDTLVRSHGPLPASRVLHLLHQACHSLAEAHDAGLVHRDVKPANLVLCRLGRDVDVVKILDFGLARRIASTSTTATSSLGPTLVGEVVGTPAFFAPELAAGTAVDGRVDLYALGCVGYWLLTGAWVFPAGPPMQMIADHVGATPDPPSSRTELPVPPDLEAILLRCLAKSPEDRFPDADALREAIASCADYGGWTRSEAHAWWHLHPDGR